MSERVFLDNGGVQVTQSRFVVHGQTYTMQGITSVRTDVKVTEAKRTWPIIWIIVSVVGVVGSIGLLFEGNWNALWGLLWGAVLAASISWYRSKKDEIAYVIILTSVSGETQALASQDEDWIDQVLTALNNAIIARG